MSNIETIKILYTIVPKIFTKFENWCFKHPKYPNFYYVTSASKKFITLFEEQLLNDGSIILEETTHDTICINVFCNSETLKSLRNYIKFMEL